VQIWGPEFGLRLQGLEFKGQPASPSAVSAPGSPRA